MRKVFSAPGVVAGLVGVLLVAVLFVANGLLDENGGRGLNPAWPLLLVMPGALAAHLSLRDGGSRYSWAREAVLAGVLSGSLAALVWAVWLVIGVATIDWVEYAQQIGAEIANRVRDVAVPATALAIVVAAITAYAGCVLAAMLGAAGYVGLRRLVSK